jgi:hypothetical protein
VHNAPLAGGVENDKKQEKSKRGNCKSVCDKRRERTFLFALTTKGAEKIPAWLFFAGGLFIWWAEWKRFVSVRR